jgi:hypothetical protein
MPTQKNGSNGSGTDKEVMIFDLARHVVTIGNTTFPTRALTQATAERFAAQYDGKPVPIADLEEAFACDDPENAGSFVIKKLKAIAKQLLLQDQRLLFTRAFGVNGGGRIVGIRYASFDDREAQDQHIDAMLRAQRARARASERYDRLLDAAKKRGLTIAE